MTIPMGDAEVIIERGAIVLKEKNKDNTYTYKTPDGKSYKTPDEAFIASAMQAAGVDKWEFDVDGNPTGTMKLDGIDTTVTRSTDGEMTFKGDTKEGHIEANSLNDYIQAIVDQ